MHVQRHQPNRVPPSPGTHPEILVVDDDPSSRRLLAAVLESSGFSARQAKNGLEAISYITSSVPDLVLLDLEMPELDGAETCTRIRHHARADIRELPVIMLTAHDGETEEVRCLESGANDFVAKPVGRAALNARIQTQLRLRSLSLELRAQNEELERWRASQIADLEAARITQQALIPAHSPKIRGWTIESHFAPLIQVGGDVYGWRPLPDGSLVVWLADATGHGAAAALFTTLTALLFQNAGLHTQSPSAMLREVNREFHSVFRGRSFLTACCAILSPDGSLTYSSAGHPPMLVRRDTGQVTSYPASGTMIGIQPSLDVEEHVIPMNAGEHALFFTDGLYSLRHRDAERMSWNAVENRLQDAARNGPLLPALLEFLQGDSNGDAFDDDVTALALQRVVA